MGSIAERKGEQGTMNSRKSPLALLLENVILLSNDKKRCAETLTALTEGRCLGEMPKKDEHSDCYWILLSTHFINRMIQVLEKRSKEDSDSIAVVMATLCHALTIILLSDKAKLERSANVATASHSVAKFVRSVLGRAIVTITIASTLALERLVVTVQHKTNPILIRRALWSALFSLDMVIHLNVVKQTVSVDGWHHAVNSLLEDSTSWDFPAMESTIQNATIALQLSHEEISLIHSIVEVHNALAEGKSKRGGRRSAAKKNSILAESFEAIIESAPANKISMDGRIPVRRWASMAFVWFCQGQLRGMDIVASLLENEEFWSIELECPARSIEFESSTKKKGNKGKVKIPEANAVEMIHVPGTVALTTLAARFIDIICMSGSNIGTRAPTGGMDTYAAAVLSPLDMKKKNLKQVHVLDIRNVSTVVIYNLIRIHVKCITENVKLIPHKEIGKKRFVVLNDDTSGFSSPVVMRYGEPHGIGDVVYYPSLHKTLDSLCRVAPTNILLPNEAIAESTKKLLTITSSYIMGSVWGDETTRIVDVKLYNFAISHLGNTLRVLFEDEEDAEDDVDDSDVNYDITAKRFAALKPLPVPVMQKVKARKKKGVDGFDDCTFAGIFDIAKSCESDLVLDEDLFTLFLRAFLKEDSCTGSLPSIFFSEMLELLQCCYDTRDNRQLSSQHTSGSSFTIPQGKHKRRKIAEKENTANELEMWQSCRYQ